MQLHVFKTLWRCCYYCCFCFPGIGVIIFLALILNSVITCMIISNKRCMFVSVPYIFIFFGFYRFSWGSSLSFIADPSPFWFCGVWNNCFKKMTLHEEISLFYILTFMLYRWIHMIKKSFFCSTSLT
jgi:hypothetical protein